MCFALNFCGWGLDIVTRCWTFAMSACIMTAVGGTLVTSAMSGVALGYNYSLAEYMQLRETNVSVYLKRGVFDDEVADEMDFRRKEGGLPSQDGIERLGSGPMYPSDESRRSGRGSHDSSAPYSGRRLDDSIFESGEPRGFEGSLLRLTAKAPVNLAEPVTATMYSLSSPEFITTEEVVGDVLRKYRVMGKAMQGYINRLRMDQTSVTPPILPNMPPVTPDPFLSLRRFMPRPEVRPQISTGDPRNADLIDRNYPDFEGAFTQSSSLSDIELLRKPTTPPSIYEPARVIRTTTEQGEIPPMPDDSDKSDAELPAIKIASDEEGKDYDDEDIKGFPFRRKRSKRNVREYISSTVGKTPNFHAKEHGASNKTIKTNKIVEVIKERNKRNENGLLDKFVAILRNVKEKVFHQDQEKESETTMDSINNSTPSVAKKNNSDILGAIDVSKIEPASNEDLILKLIKLSLN